MRRLVMALAVCATVTACTDRPKQGPTEPQAQSPVPAAQPATSSVCLAYARKIAKLQAAVAAAPGDAVVAGRLQVVQGLAAESCE